MRERERTGISSLKVRPIASSVTTSRFQGQSSPRAERLRSQTGLVGAERCYAGERIRRKDPAAEEKILEIEKNLFQQVRSRIAVEAHRIRQTAATTAEFDVLASFASLAQRFNYSRPQISVNDEFVVSKGRHPVIEALAEEHRADRFVPNDLFMNDSMDQILIVTGQAWAANRPFFDRTPWW